VLAGPGSMLWRASCRMSLCPCERRIPSCSLPRWRQLWYTSSFDDDRHLLLSAACLPLVGVCHTHIRASQRLPPSREKCCRGERDTIGALAPAGEMGQSPAIGSQGAQAFALALQVRKPLLHERIHQRIKANVNRNRAHVLMLSAPRADGSGMTRRPPPGCGHSSSVTQHRSERHRRHRWLRMNYWHNRQQKIEPSPVSIPCSSRCQLGV